jgi:hypothetical protein
VAKNRLYLNCGPVLIQNHPSVSTRTHLAAIGANIRLCRRPVVFGGPGLHG